MFDFMFYFLSVVCIGSALVVAFTPHVVHAALALVPTFGSLAGLYILLGADFLGITQVSIYIGAILVLMLFGIMYTHNIMGTSGKEVMMQVGPALVVVVITLFILMSTVLATSWPTKQDPLPPPAATIEPLGIHLLTDYLLPFEIASMLLLIALVGAVVVAHSRPVRKENKD